MTTVVAVAALVIAVAALVLALLVLQQSARIVVTVRRHRLGHRRTYGTADPDRRRADIGPPDGQDDRRPPITPPRVTPRQPDEADADEADTVERPAYRPRHERPEDDTAEHPPPTAQFRRPPPPIPRSTP